MRGRLIWVAVLSGGFFFPRPVYTQVKEAPVGVVLAADGALILRKSRPQLDAAAGDLLFPGDILRTGKTGSISFAFCPGTKPPARRSAAANAEINVEHDRIVDRAKKLTESEDLPFCRLPEVEPEPELGSKGSEDLSKRVADPSAYAKAVAGLPADAAAELAKLDAALRTNPKDTLAMTSRAVLLAKNGLDAEAADQYADLAGIWKGQQWAKMLVHEKRTAAAPARRGNGATYAVVIGISKYDNPAINNLSFANRDAQVFAEYLSSPRGHQVPKENIKLLIDSAATLPRVKDSIKFLMDKAGKNDTVIFFISGHGDISEGEGYLVVNRSDPENLKDSAYPMASLFALMYEMSAKVGKFVLFVDACRSGMIGQITEKNAINQRIAQAVKNSADNVMALLASQQTELAWEHKNFDEGHSVFSYFLLRGMAADGIREADYNKDGKVSLSELIRYVQNEVPDATLDKQHPDKVVKIADWSEEEVADIGTQGIKLGGWSPMPKDAFTGKAKGLVLEADRTAAHEEPPVPANEAELEQLIRLEEQGQQIMLQYLQGDEIPQTGVDFERGRQLYDQALSLAPGSLYLESRREFFHGRRLISDKQYGDAISHLEASIRLNPRSPSPYNALGIAYLELGQYNEAIAAFTSATSRAWYWPYPRHNLALAYMQMGRYVPAIAEYRKAMQLAPGYSYLPYNLGLVFQKMNRNREAEDAFLEAQRLADLRARQSTAPALAEAYAERKAAPLIALGLLKAEEGRDSQAAALYKDALAALALYPSNQNRSIAQHDLALLLSRKKETWGAAEDLLKKNVDAGYIPSEQRMAEWLADRGEAARAAPYFEKLLAAKPEYTAARLRLADVQEKLGDTAAARKQLETARDKDPENARVLFALADFDARQKNWDTARQAYQAALVHATDPKLRTQIRRAMKRLP